jgi:hypothetical protein
VNGSNYNFTISAGIDTNGDGQLQPSEIDETINIHAQSVSGTVDDPVNPSASTPAQFTITRGGDTTVALDVYYKLAGNSVYGVDYSGAASTSNPDIYKVTIPAGAASTALTFTPLNAAFNAQEKSILVTLIGASPAILGIGKFSVLNTGAVLITQQSGTVTQVPPTTADLINALQQAVNNNDPVTNLSILGHADNTFITLDNNQEFIQMNANGTKIMANQADITNLMNQALTQDAHVALKGCHSGSGQNSLAQQMSTVLPGRSVSGGKRYLLRVGKNTVFGKFRYFRNGQEQ